MEAACTVNALGLGLFGSIGILVVGILVGVATVSYLRHLPNGGGGGLSCGMLNGLGGWGTKGGFIVEVLVSCGK